MWDVSDRFLAALAKPHRVATEVTFTPPGGDVVQLSLKAGTVTNDAQARTRRTARLNMFGTRADYELLNTPGGVLHIDHGIKFGSDSELVPVFHGELTGAAQELGDGSIAVRCGDMNTWLTRTDFLKPYAPAAGLLRTTVITNIVKAAKPGVTVLNTATDTGTVQSPVWDKSRTDAINDLTKDGGTEAFFRPDGVFLIRDQLTLSSAPAWTITPGSGGTLKPGVTRERPMDRLYNTVVVRPSATDGSQKWKQQVVQVTDLTHPRHPSKIGVVPYVWASPTARTAAAARSAGRKLLARVLGTTETLALESLSNPALEAGDPIRVITPALRLEPAQAFQHFIDSYTLDLSSGGMSLNTRSQVTDV